MRMLAFCFTALLSMSAMAQGIPGPGQPGPGPGYGNIDPCNATYEGWYEKSGGPLTIKLRRAPRADFIRVTLIYRGQIYRGSGRCDSHLANWRLNDGWPHAVEFNWAYDTPSMRGTQWVRGQPYQNFYLDYSGW